MYVNAVRLAIFGAAIVVVVTSIAGPGAAHARAQTGFTITLEEDVPARMRDGVALRADVLRPDSPGRFPVILYRTPYGKSGVVRDDSFAIRAAKSGYVVVVQDVRGRYASDGRFDPYRQEGHDGYDTIEWAARLPYADGNVGMAGLSYPGAVQWLAAVEAPPSLKAIAPAMCFSTGRRFFYFGGTFDLSWLGWFYLNIAPNERVRLNASGPKTYEEASREWERHLDEWLRFLPLREVPALSGVSASYFEFLEHPDDGPYWSYADIVTRHERVQVPSFNLSGWHDEGYGPWGAVENFNGTRHLGSRLVLGPWTHGTPRLDRTKEGELDFGVNAGFDYHGELLRWFDRWLKGLPANDESAPVLLFVMGANVWREEREWPLARARQEAYYLDEGGVLSAEPPGVEEAFDAYTYDPSDPVVDPHGGVQGPYDQSPLETRADVLTYTSEVLREDVEVTGPIEVELWASSSARDTDLVVRLLDVHPDGRAFNVMSPTLEVLRGRYRESESSPKWITPNEPTLFRLRNGITSNLFRAGHRIRIHVTSSIFPHVDRNLNTDEPFGASTRIEKADQRIFRDRTRPSRVLLPVIPQRP
jgi:putative CocE/NonD family hydrolase